MEGKRLLHTLRLTNFLSYGPEGEEIELQPLNVLIGPNGSGKSNLIEAIALLKAAPSDIAAPIRAGGGMPEWIWKGEKDEKGSSSGESATSLNLTIETTVDYRKGRYLRYRFQLAGVGQGLQFLDERIDSVASVTPEQNPVESLYSFENGGQVLIARETMIVDGQMVPSHGTQHLGPGHIDLTRSILSQRKDPDRYPELTYLGDVLSRIELFRNCNVDPARLLHGPQRIDQPSSFLSENGSNLGMVLNNLLNRVPERLLGELQRFYEYVEDIRSRVELGTVETVFRERGFRDSTPSTRLSDGTLRYLCLLTILCHPSPPPLVCIEDPEIALHPDVLPILAELMIELSQKTQLVVTTHSDVLVSALSDVPEAVVVCERDEFGSHLRRLEPDRLKEWLEKYPLGELWRMGETGGNPW